MNNSNKTLTLPEKPGFSWAASLAVHTLVFAVLLILARVDFGGVAGRGQGGTEIDLGGLGLPGTAAVPLQGEQAINPATAQQNQQPGNTVTNSTANGSGVAGLGGAIMGADTSGLSNLYAETTLNVQIKYPPGWNYVDQNVKRKLDGVTFVGMGGTGAGAPYVHLEVRDPDAFIASRFRNNTPVKGVTLYYNDPSELEGQVSQVVYIRTGGSEDYSIKLVVTGVDNFKAFQPMFFAMIRSFRFGNSWF